MNEGELTVSSEIYEENNYVTNAAPTINQNNVVSKFPFRLPAPKAKLDEDGDPIVDRRPGQDGRYDRYVEIEHSARTGLELVGLQVWRGALLLADWLVEELEEAPPPAGLVLELGSGVGLTSIVAARYTSVVCTDVDRGGILQLIGGNVKRNRNLLRHDVRVLPLDFTQPLSQELKDLLPNVAVILAADVVYDDDITCSFVDRLSELLRLCPAGGCAAFVALEQRYVFTLDELMTGAPCYHHFLHQLSLHAPHLRAHPLDIDFPQYFQYDRCQELVLWKITYNHADI